MKHSVVFLGNSAFRIEARASLGRLNRLHQLVERQKPTDAGQGVLAIANLWRPDHSFDVVPPLLGRLCGAVSKMSPRHR